LNEAIFLALRILLHNRVRLLCTSAGIGAVFFLTAALTGLLVGWCNTTSAIIRHAGADVWLMAEKTPALDYGTPIPRSRIYQARSVQGVAWAEGMFLAFNSWQRPDGRKLTVELVGLDEGLAGAPWQMKTGSAGVVQQPDRVIVDDLYLDFLGVRNIDDEVQLLGRRAVVGGISQDVRSFTTLPFVFASLKSALRYDPTYRSDEITYVLVRCAPGYDADKLREVLTREIPHVEALTTQGFAVRTNRYWMLETGAGITVVLTGLLSLLVGGVIVNQALVSMTHDHLPNYITLLALGFSRAQLTAVVVTQALVLGLAGVLLGSMAFVGASRLTVGTHIPVETTGGVFLGLAGTCLACCLIASMLASRSVYQIEPLSVFRT
jgi:putative ABC transport system permease protein